MHNLRKAHGISARKDALSAAGSKFLLINTCSSHAPITSIVRRETSWQRLCSHELRGTMISNDVND